MRTTLGAALIGLMSLSGARAGAQAKCGEAFEVAAGTPREAIAKIIVDQMFDEISLTDDQQSKAVAIVAQGMSDQSKLDRKASDYQDKRTALEAKQHADLMKVLTKDSDKAKLTACFKKMERPAGGRGGGGYSSLRIL